MLRAACLSLSLLGLAVALVGGGEAACPDPTLTGTWRGEVTAEVPPFGRLEDLMTFTPAGVVLESRRAYAPGTPLGPLLQSGGHGVWTRVGGDDYRVRFVFLLQGAPDHPELAGAPLGTDTVTLALSLGGGDRLTGSFESEIRDTRGRHLLTVRGTYEGVRLTASDDCAG